MWSGARNSLLIQQSLSGQAPENCAPPAPADNKFSQQELPAIRPVLTPKWVRPWNVEDGTDASPLWRFRAARRPPRGLLDGASCISCPDSRPGGNGAKLLRLHRLGTCPFGKSHRLWMLLIDLHVAGYDSWSQRATRSSAFPDSCSGLCLWRAGDSYLCSHRDSFCADWRQMPAGVAVGAFSDFLSKLALTVSASAPLYVSALCDTVLTSGRLHWHAECSASRCCEAALSVWLGCRDSSVRLHLSASQVVEIVGRYDNVCARCDAGTCQGARPPSRPCEPFRFHIRSYALSSPLPLLPFSAALRHTHLHAPPSCLPSPPGKTTAPPQGRRRALWRCASTRR